MDLDTNRKWRPWTIAALGLLALVAILAWCAPGPRRDPAPPPDPEFSAAEVAACEAALAALGGLVLDRPDRGQVDVDETLWAALPAKTKRQLADSVRCAASASGERFGYVYGYRSGKRLALAMEAGVTLD